MKVLSGMEVRNKYLVRVININVQKETPTQRETLAGIIFEGCSKVSLEINFSYVYLIGLEFCMAGLILEFGNDSQKFSGCYGEISQHYWQEMTSSLMSKSVNFEIVFLVSDNLLATKKLVETYKFVTLEIFFANF